MTPQELKNSILQLAIQGKLVEQRPEEGTAEELYREIQAEKRRLIKAGKLKKEKPLPEITEEEKPFEIPESWMWCRLGNVLKEVIVPMRDKPPFSKTGIPWCRIEDRDGILLNGTKSNQLVSEDTIREMNLKIVPIGTVLSACTGGSIGTIVINTVECCTNQTFNGLVCSSGLLNWYLFWFLTTKLDELRRVGTGTTIAYVSQKKSKMMVFPLPPLAEQKRIVAKIEELLPYIDRYEQAWSRLEAFNQRFPDDMRKSILQLAIQGKLVEQRPEEGTAEELYQEIQAEKQRLIKAGKIKKEKPLPEITEEEKPFEIPESWMWVRLGSIVKKLTDGSHNPPPNTGKGYPVISAKNIKNGLITFENVDRYTDENGFKKENPRTDITTGDIILGIIGGSIGNVAIYTHEAKVIAQRSIAILTTMIESSYFINVLKSPLIQNGMHSSAAGSAQGGVYLGTLSNFLIPLPPLAEQKRIVARLEELLAVCERLK